MERLLENTEVALTNKFVENRRLQYTNTSLLTKVFNDSHGKERERERERVSKRVRGR